MDSKTFEAILLRRLNEIQKTLASKAKEYAKCDRLHNFKRAGELQATTPEKALLGMATKHFVSVLDIVDDMKDGIMPTQPIIDEKIGDSINYLILLEAMICERADFKVARLEDAIEIVGGTGTPIITKEVLG